MASRKDSRGRVLTKGEYQRPNGKYVYQYTDAIGRRKSAYANDLVTLREKERRIKTDQWDGIDIDKAKIVSINEVFDRYMSTKYNLRASTRASYNDMYNRYLRDDFGKRKISSVKYSDIQQFYYYLMEEKRLKIRSVEYIHMLLHPTFELAVRDGIIRLNPTQDILGEVKRNTGEKATVRHALTEEQQREFLRFIEVHPYWGRYHSIFTVLLGTGCRVGEIIGIRWCDLDFEKRTVDINHNIVEVKPVKGVSKRHLKVNGVKTDAGVRIVPMMDPVFEAFKKEYLYQELHGFKSCTVDGYTDFVFCKDNGNIYSAIRLDEIIRKAIRDYNKQETVIASKEEREPHFLPHFSCHTLRHTFASRLCERDVNVKVIQSVMGHANIGVTLDIYAEVSERKKQEEIQKMAKDLDIF